MQPGKAPRRRDFYSANKQADLLAPLGAGTAISAAPWWAVGRAELRQWGRLDEAPGPPEMMLEDPRCVYPFQDHQGPMRSDQRQGHWKTRAGQTLAQRTWRGRGFCVGPPNPGPFSAIPWGSRQVLGPPCCDTLSRKKEIPGKQVKRC